MNDVGVFPGLGLFSGCIIEVCRGETYSWESSVVPEISLVWEAIADEAKFAFLDVLLDRVEEFFFRDL